MTVSVSPRRPSRASGEMRKEKNERMTSTATISAIAMHHGRLFVVQREGGFCVVSQVAQPDHITEK